MELTPFDGIYHANVDFINSGSNGGAGVPYQGLGSSKINSDGSIPVRNAADDSIVVNEDYTINLQGWMAVNGGINHYAYTINGGELITAAGGSDGEPLDGYYAGFGMNDSLKNGLFKNENVIVADLSAYAGQTVTVTFYAIPEAAQDTVAPMITIEGLVVPAAAVETPVYTAWDADKAIVGHQSFDELYYSDARTGIFTPGQSATWDKVATLDASVAVLNYWGWVAYMDEGLGQFGYQIDGNDVVFSDSFAHETGADVVNAGGILAPGSKGASRMLIAIDVAGLTGEHTVNVLYKNPNGDIVALCTFTLVK